MTMTHGQKTILNNEVVKALEEDKAKKKSYSYALVITTIVFVVIAVITLIIQNVIRVYGSESWFSFIMLGLIFASVIPLGMMVGDVIRAFRFPVLSTGKRYVKAWMFLCLFLMGVLAFSPFAMLVRLDSINFKTRLFEMGILKSYLIGIGLGVIFFLYGWIKSWKEPLYSEGSSMSPADYQLMRQNQIEAGLDPDKMPIMLDGGRVKSMSVQDWHSLGVDLHLAGYDVFREGFC